MMPSITKEIAIKAVLLGACDMPRVGKKLRDFSTSDLIWAENAELISKEELRLVTDSELPLWVMSGYGSGSGDGYGYGDGPISKALKLLE